MRFVFVLLARNVAAGLTAFKLAVVRIFVQPAIYLFVFGHVVGRILPGGTSYSWVMAPGIVAIATMTAPMMTINGYLISGYFFRSIENLLLAPVSPRSLLFSMLTVSTVSGMANSLVVVAIAWLLLGVFPVNIALLLLMIVAGALLFSLLIFIALLLPERPDKGQEALSFLLMPMTFFGCTFFSYEMLEAPFKWIALFLPTTYISEGLRAAYMPDGPHLDIAVIIGSLCVTLAMLLLCVDWAFRRRLGNFTW